MYNFDFSRSKRTKAFQTEWQKCQIYLSLSIALSIYIYTPTMMSVRVLLYTLGWTMHSSGVRKTPWKKHAPYKFVFELRFDLYGRRKKCSWSVWLCLMPVVKFPFEFWPNLNRKSAQRWWMHPSPSPGISILFDWDKQMVVLILQPLNDSRTGKTGKWRN